LPGGGVEKRFDFETAFFVGVTWVESVAVGAGRRVIAGVVDRNELAKSGEIGFETSFEDDRDLVGDFD